jgi:hypothetical protein
MAYARLTTRNVNALHPNFRGLGAYAALSTQNRNGLSPNFRGLGDTPLTNISFGPGGQFSISTVTTPTQESLSDQVLTWLSESTFVPGMPNSVFAIGGGLLALAWLFGGRRRR